MSLVHLTSEERQALNASQPLASLAPSLRHEILTHCTVRRYVHGDWIVAAGQPALEWLCCVKGAVKAGQGGGRHAVLTYVQPGTWLGEAALIGAAGHPHDATAHGATTMVALPGAYFNRLLREAPDFASAVLLQQAMQAQTLFEDIGDWRRLQLRPRLAKQLVRLAGLGSSHQGGRAQSASYVGLTQGELARVVGASRQRVNHVLKAMERDRLITSGRDGIHIRDLDALRNVRS